MRNNWFEKGKTLEPFSSSVYRNNLEKISEEKSFVISSWEIVKGKILKRALETTTILHEQTLYKRKTFGNLNLKRAKSKSGYFF